MLPLTHTRTHPSRRPPEISFLDFHHHFTTLTSWNRIDLLSRLISTGHTRQQQHSLFLPDTNKVAWIPEAPEDLACQPSEPRAYVDSHPWHTRMEEPPPPPPLPATHASLLIHDLYKSRDYSVCQPGDVFVSCHLNVVGSSVRPSLSMWVWLLLYFWTHLLALVCILLHPLNV